MSHTILSVGWLKFFTQDTDTDISVNKEIRTVYRTLRQEGVDVQIARIDENCNCQIVKEEEINEEQEEVNYRLEVDLANSNIPMKRFNELLEIWGVTEVSN
ncbi:hypothetical protein [Brasilonema sp. UFV-L1]|uniref:hypothetical protein n=1 Tax=Brasilonema sp. UFV-L1 TaxID=2234130 RepID=UPI00145C9BDE|nr:hypothetical protein [Brasilonema sp. UFV-L1]NMG11261.1 hypothetical protein [Brasilonema sp. UFV-L1]